MEGGGDADNSPRPSIAAGRSSETSLAGFHGRLSISSDHVSSPHQGSAIYRNLSSPWDGANWRVSSRSIYE